MILSLFNPVLFGTFRKIPPFYKPRAKSFGGPPTAQEQRRNIKKELRETD